MKTAITQANRCLELFIGVVRRSPRAGKESQAKLTSQTRGGKDVAAAEGEKGELAPTGTVTNYDTIGTCQKK